MSNGSGRYTAAYTHPDPMDPNDRVRQKTHARSIEFPYDRPVRYGEPESQAMDGSKYQDGGYGGQLTPWFVKDDDGDLDEASGTPYMFGRSSLDIRADMDRPIDASLRSFAGPHRDDLEVEPHEVFGEAELNVRDMVRDELRAMGEDLLDLIALGDEDGWPELVRIRQMRALEGMHELEGEVDLSFIESMDLGECFAVHNPDGPEVISLLETLDWDD